MSHFIKADKVKFQTRRNKDNKVFFEGADIVFLNKVEFRDETQVKPEPKPQNIKTEIVKKVDFVQDVKNTVTSEEFNHYKQEVDKKFKYLMQKIKSQFNEIKNLNNEIILLKEKNNFDTKSFQDFV